MLSVLIVDDDPAVRAALEALLGLKAISCRHAATAAEALRIAEQQPLALVLLDMNLAPERTCGSDGRALFHRLRALDPELPVTLMTAWSSIDAAVQMTREGAVNYIEKPWDDARLLAEVADVVRRRRATIKRRGEPELCGLVYESAAMQRVIEVALRAAARDVAVLISGPSGTGKERIADVIVANSPRRDGPYVRLNAAALPDNLIEAELFGAEAGAFTGAARRRIGRIEAADKGSLFLDEIGCLSERGQAKLLRALSIGELQRLGATETKRVDVRLICATNVDLRQAAAEGRFREDLYYRLAVVEIALPPLRDRPSDILPLARHFLARQDEHRPLRGDAIARLRAHPWPGNVRELENRTRRAAALSVAPELTAADFGLDRPAPVAPLTPEAVLEAHAGADERTRIEAVLRSTGGNISRAAEVLGLSRQALYRRMQRLDIVMVRQPR